MGRETALLEKLFSGVDRINNALGVVFSWLVGLLILNQFAVVLLRYVFGVGSIKLQESIIYIHAFILMILCAYTLLKDGHVRLDLFYSNRSARAQAALDVFGAAVYLLPLSIFIFFDAMGYVLRSWSVFESSREMSGLPGVFLLKTLILCFAALLFLQGLSMIWRAVRTLVGADGPKREA